MGNFATSISLLFKDQFSVGFNKATRNFIGLKNSLNDLSRETPLTKTASQLSMMSMNFRQTQESFSAFAQKPRELGIAMEDSLKIVNSVVNESNALGGNVSKSMSIIQNEAEAWTKTHSDLATDFTKNSYVMVGAGLNVQESIFGTKQALLLAKATQGTVGDSTNLLADSYNNMGKKIFDSQGNVINAQEEMTRLSDVIAKTQGLFKIENLDQLNQGLKYSIPTANAFKISFEQLNSVIGQMNTTGLSGSMAGTSFNAFVTRLDKASKNIGFNIVYNQTGEMDLIQTIGNLKTKYDSLQSTLGTQSTASLLQKNFGDEGIKGASNLINTYPALIKGYNDILGASKNAGTTQEMYNTITDTTSNKLQILQNREDSLKRKVWELANATDNAGISIKSTWLNIQETMLQNPLGQGMAVFGYSFANVGSGLMSTSGKVLDFTSSMLTIAAVTGKTKPMMKLFTSSFKMMTTPISIAIEGLGKFGKGLGGASSSIPGFVSNMSKAADASKFFGISSIAAAGYVGLIVIGIAAWGFALYEVIKNWETVQKFLRQDNQHNPYTNWIHAAKAYAAIAMWPVGIPLLIATYWKEVTGVFGVVKNKALEFIDLFKNNSLVRSSVIIGSAIVFPFLTFVRIPALIIANLDKIKEGFKKFKGWVSGIFKNFWKDTIGNIGDAWKNTPFAKIIDSVSNWIDKNIFNAGKKIPVTLSNGVQSDKKTLKDSVNKNLTTVKPLLNNSDAKEGPFSTLTKHGKNIIKTLAFGVETDKSLKTSINKNFKDSFVNQSSLNNPLKQFDLKSNLQTPPLNFEEKISKNFDFETNKFPNNVLSKIINSVIQNTNSNSQETKNIIINLDVKNFVEKIEELEKAVDFLKIIAGLSGVQL